MRSSRHFPVKIWEHLSIYCKEPPRLVRASAILLQLNFDLTENLKINTGQLELFRFQGTQENLKNLVRGRTWGLDDWCLWACMTAWWSSSKSTTYEDILETKKVDGNVARYPITCIVCSQYCVSSHRIICHSHFHRDSASDETCPYSSFLTVPVLIGREAG